MKHVSKNLYVGAYVGGLVLGLVLLGISIAVMFVGGVNSARTGEAPTAATAGVMGIMCVAYIPLIFSAIMMYILLYKAWAAIQNGPVPVRTTPGKAVGFMFIPLFNIYWMFMAFWGWTKDYNAVVAQTNPSAPRMPETLALVACVSGLIGCAPVAIVAFTMLIGKMCDGINAIADAQGAA